MRSRVAMLFVVLALAMGGCVRIDIGDTVPTLGEELIDLQNAKDLGALTEEELASLRRMVLARY